MCGICGFISKKGITLEQLKTMNDTMYHRGPNDSGVFSIHLVKTSKAFSLVFSAIIAMASSKMRAAVAVLPSKFNLLINRATSTELYL